MHPSVADSWPIPEQKLQLKVTYIRVGVTVNENEERKRKMRPNKNSVAFHAERRHTCSLAMLFDQIDFPKDVYEVPCELPKRISQTPFVVRKMPWRTTS